MVTDSSQALYRKASKKRKESFGKVLRVLGRDPDRVLRPWEKISIDWVLLRPMIFRNEREFAELLIEGSFAPENIQLRYEPFRIHGIVVCKK